MCACGQSFAACDTVEALLHITTKSGDSHHWVYINTGVFEAGRLIDPPNLNPTGISAYMFAKYARRP